MACSVDTSGTSKCSASAIAGWATSQSCAWTTSGRQSPDPLRPRANPARTMACPMASVQAIMSVPKSKSWGSSAAATTRTPSEISSEVG
ncbi:Uncharacterised protein [Mycobacteroides abscessus subsp. abscessus]|nr:Uncharacterised protein [Mycobacteroides abscessus subsp. abscessus]